MTSPTPGPWTFNAADGTVRTKDFSSNMMGDYQGCIVCDLKPAVGSDQWPPYSREHAVPEALANARLIAAAPEMLDLLKHVLACGAEGYATSEKIKDLIAKVEG